VTPKRLSARAGVEWFACGWGLFRLAPLNWLLLGVSLAAVNVLLALVPVLGPVLLLVVTPALYGGIAFAAREQTAGGRPRVEHLLAAVREPRSRAPMIRLGVHLLAVYLLALLIGSFVLGAVAGMLDIELIEGEMQAAPRAEDLTKDALVLVMAMLAIVDVVVAALFFFAIPLVMFHSLAPGAAIQAGIRAAIMNIGPMFVFLLINVGLGALVLAGALTLPPLALALVVVVSVSLAAWYCAFQSVYGDGAAPSTLAA
jgi:uncharacterized membrane protein